jgi:hypothetical protein
MAVGRVLGSLMLVGLAALLFAGCSSSASVQLSSKRMCEAVGGTYVGTTCNPAAGNQRTAKQMCDAHGGTYMPDLDVCQMEATK